MWARKKRCDRKKDVSEKKEMWARKNVGEKKNVSEKKKMRARKKCGQEKNVGGREKERHFSFPKILNRLPGWWQEQMEKGCKHKISCLMFNINNSKREYFENYLIYAGLKIFNVEILFNIQRF